MYRGFFFTLFPKDFFGFPILVIISVSSKSDFMFLDLSQPVTTQGHQTTVSARCIAEGGLQNAVFHWATVEHRVFQCVE